MRLKRKGSMGPPELAPAAVMDEARPRRRRRPARPRCSPNTAPRSQGRGCRHIPAAGDCQPAAASATNQPRPPVRRSPNIFQAWERVR